MSLSAAAVAAYKARKTPVQSFYLDAGQFWRYWGPERAYHQTGMINMIYALREALLEVREEGLEARWARHSANQQALIAGLQGMGLKPAVEDAALRLPSLTTVMVPEGADDKMVRGRLLQRIRHRDRRRAGQVRGQGLAHRADGLCLAAQSTSCSCSRRWATCSRTSASTRAWRPPRRSTRRPRSI